jgi:hypothetical protein
LHRLMYFWCIPTGKAGQMIHRKNGGKTESCVVYCLRLVTTVHMSEKKCVRPKVHVNEADAERRVHKSSIIRIQNRVGVVFP